MSLSEPVHDLTPPFLRRRSEADREADPTGWLALRRLGVDLAQDLSGAVWTDYNLHDPGVTILEALCYALTELAFRVEIPTADHLSGEDGEIDYGRQALFPPNEILRARPTTENDYRRVFLDKIGGLADVQLKSSSDDKAVPGLLRLSLRPADLHAFAEAEGLGDRVTPAETRDVLRRRAHEIYRGLRTFGEDLDDDVRVTETVPHVLSLRASITGMRDPADIVAEIYRRCADEIAGAARPHSLAELVFAGAPLEDVLEGPLTHYGIIRPEDLPRPVRGKIGVSRLRELVLSIDGVTEVAMLAIEAEPPEEGASPPPADGAPALVTPGDGSHRKDVDLLARITLLRRGMPVHVDARAVASRHSHDLHPNLVTGADRDEFERIVPPPKSRHRPPPAFRSVQEEFPVVYGLGRWGAGGGSASGGRVEQLKGYLTLFDQLLADMAAQTRHMRDLFTPYLPQADEKLRSYWREPLTNDQLPGVEQVQADPVGMSGVYAAFDAATDRRSRALDHLLALYGESATQNTMRQFLDYLDSTELGAALLGNKAEYLRETLRLGRDRAAGWDTRLRLWPDAGADPAPAEPATTGLQARIGLLLGFQDWRARSLTAHAAGAATGRTSRRRARRRGQEREAVHRPSEQDRTWALTWPSVPPAEHGMSDLDLNSHLIVHGVNRERFRWQPDLAGGGGELQLTDARDYWRSLGRFDTEAEAGQYAARLRLRLLEFNAASDGLHIVEHVLLRPRSTLTKRSPDPAFHGLRVTFVFPDWTARTSRPAFRRFAAETVAINCPAHVVAECLWLDFEDMREFEAAFAAWTRALNAYSKIPPRTPPTEEGRADLDAAAEKVEDFLRRTLPLQALANSVEGV